MHPHYTHANDEQHSRAQVRSLTDSAVPLASSSKSTPSALRPRTLNSTSSAPMRYDNDLFFQSKSGASTSRLFQGSPGSSSGSSRAQSFYPPSVAGLPNHRETMPPRTKKNPGLLPFIPPPPPFPATHTSGPRFQPLPFSTSPISLPLQGLPESQTPAPIDESEEDVMKANMSSPSEEGDKRRKDSQDAEEEALAQAMEASVLNNGPGIHAYVSSVLQQPQTTSPQAQSSSELPASNSDAEPLILMPPQFDQNQIEEDELFARRLAEEDAEREEQRRRDDEAFARQLAEQEESSASTKSSEAMRDLSPSSPEANALPRYSSSPPSQNRFSGKEKMPHHSNTSEPPTRPVSANSSPTSNQTGLYRPLSAEQPNSLSVNPKAARLSAFNTKSFTNLGELTNDTPINPNNFVDADLLNGVSLNFVAPVIAPYLVPMQGPMPNIISLPYGRCPPLHLQAPNWKHLLTLLARLSGTRIEPTVEAMAMNKGDLKLRTVIQCVRTHHASTDWRTVLWFTIDHPVPPNMPGAQKFLNGDPAVLPFSYSLSVPPALLRDGCDTPMSKYYTVPTTDAIPFPTLPISFPDLARYLQAVVQESRKYMNDSSSGMRKLAKMIDQCYPSHMETSLYPTENIKTSTFGDMFKRVVRRNGRKTRGENEDGGYLLVTPFVPNEWG